MTFGQRLTTLREDRDLTLHEAACACGFDARQWRHWEDELQKPKMDTLPEIVAGLDLKPVDLMWLITGIRPRGGGA